MAHLDPSTLRAFLSDAADELTGRRPVTHWLTWRARVGVSVAVGALAAGCGGESEAGSVGEGRCSGDDCVEECTDGVDNDGDGGVDCDDPDCADASACLEATGGTGGIGVLYGNPYTGGDGPFGGTGGEPSGGTGGDLLGGSGGTETGGVETGGGGTGGLGGTGGGLGGAYGIPFGGTGGVPVGGTGGIETGGTGGIETGGTGGVPVGGTGGIETGGTGSAAAAGGQPAYGIPLEDCYNGYDDDYDGYVDCDDPDCMPECGSADYAVPFEYDCADGYDNDYDGYVDCDDPDCSCQSTGGTGGTGGYPPGTGGLYSVPF